MDGEGIYFWEAAGDAAHFTAPRDPTVMKSQRSLMKRFYVEKGQLYRWVVSFFIKWM